MAPLPLPPELVVGAAPSLDELTVTPGNKVPLHRAGTPAAKTEISEEGHAWMQVIRLVPISESHVHWSRAAPVSLPLQVDEAADVFSQEATQGGVVVVWARVRERRGTRRKRVVFMMMSLEDSWGLCRGFDKGRPVYLYCGYFY